jgi:predicted adenine nucleotide alpha hydrolase (AANH) superfamily ATPase
MVDSLKDKTNEITAYFYNSNIHPRSEYLSRLKAAKQIAGENKIKLVVADWSPKEWFKGVERESLKNKTRCGRCWGLRLRKSFEYAKKNSFKMVSTTLLSSHYQNKDKIEEIGKNLEKEFGIKFLVPKKISRDLKTTGFYKQNYCGCCYSLVETWGEKFK